MTGVLRLTCHKCTREEAIPGKDERDAILHAQVRGWVKDGETFVCRKCPAVRTNHVAIRRRLDVLGTDGMVGA